MKMLKLIGRILLASLLTYVLGWLIAPVMFDHGSGAAFDVGILMWIGILMAWIWVIFGENI